MTDYFEFPGQTAAIEEVEVRARVTGYLVKVNFEDGQNGEKGRRCCTRSTRGPIRRRWIAPRAIWRNCEA